MNVFFDYFNREENFCVWDEYEPNDCETSIQDIVSASLKWEFGIEYCNLNPKERVYLNQNGHLYVLTWWQRMFIGMCHGADFANEAGLEDLGEL